MNLKSTFGMLLKVIDSFTLIGISLKRERNTLEHFSYCIKTFSVASSHSSNVPENPESRIFYISSFPTPHKTKKSLPPFVGMERHICTISPLEIDKVIYCALLAEGFPATEELNEVRFCLSISEKHFYVITTI